MQASSQRTAKVEQEFWFEADGLHGEIRTEKIMWPVSARPETNHLASVRQKSWMDVGAS